MPTSQLPVRLQLFMGNCYLNTFYLENRLSFTVKHMRRFLQEKFGAPYCHLQLSLRSGLILRDEQVLHHQLRSIDGLSAGDQVSIVLSVLKGDSSLASMGKPIKFKFEYHDSPPTLEGQGTPPHTVSSILREAKTSPNSARPLSLAENSRLRKSGDDDIYTAMDALINRSRSKPLGPSSRYVGGKTELSIIDLLFPGCKDIPLPTSALDS